MKKNVILIIMCLVLHLSINFASAIQPNDIDYHTMFEKRNHMDDGQIEGYYYELSALFDADPDSFIDALAQEDEQTARELAFPLAIEHQSADSAADYQSALNSSSNKQTASILKHGVLIFAATNESIDAKVFGKRCYQEMQTAYSNDHRLFLLSVSEYAMSEVYIEAVSDCLMYKLSEDGLIALNNQLSDDAKAEWADEDVNTVIETIRVKIEEHRASPKTSDNFDSFSVVSVFLICSVALLLILTLRKRILL